jgi:acetylornithine aminotransferase
VCAAGRATIAALRAEGLGENALSSGETLRAGLTSLAETTGAITHVRGAGLMVGITLATPTAEKTAAALLGEGIIVNHIGADILRFLPPLVCSDDEIDTLLGTLSSVLQGEGS